MDANCVGCVISPPCHVLKYQVRLRKLDAMEESLRFLGKVQGNADKTLYIIKQYVVRLQL